MKDIQVVAAALMRFDEAMMRHDHGEPGDGIISMITLLAEGKVVPDIRNGEVFWKAASGQPFTLN